MQYSTSSRPNKCIYHSACLLSPSVLQCLSLPSWHVRNRKKSKNTWSSSPIYGRERERDSSSAVVTVKIWKFLETPSIIHTISQFADLYDCEWLIFSILCDSPLHINHNTQQIMKNSVVIVTLGFYLLFFSAFFLLTAAFFLRLFCSVEAAVLRPCKKKKKKRGKG